MASPFPGVDPYLEDQHYWMDFHASFITYWREAINEALPAHYEARIEEQVEILELEPDEVHLMRPDISVVKPESASRVSTHQEPRENVATLAAVSVPFPVMAEVRDRRIQILHRPERSLVAVLELLSPSNKTNPGRGQYLAKRSRLFIEDLHLVEVDLLLAGERLPMGRPLPPGDYYALIARRDRRPKADVYAWTLRDRLPAIPIPLLPPDEDIVIDLAAVFATTYERGRYNRSIRYSAPLSLPLSEGAAGWAQQVAKAALQ